MQIEIFDIFGLLGFIIASFLACIKFLEYRIESDKHRAILKASWDRLPPKKNQLQKSSLLVENIGGKQAMINEITLKFSYVDAPQILAKQSWVDPGTTNVYTFDYIQPSIGEHEITATITIEHGYIRKKRRKLIVGKILLRKV